MKLKEILNINNLSEDDKKELKGIIRIINPNKSSAIDLINFENTLIHIFYDYSLNEEELKEYLKWTGLGYIHGYYFVKDEIINYFNDAEDPSVRDEWNKQDAFTADAFIKKNYLPKNNRNGFYFAKLFYKKTNKPYGLVEDFNIQNFTLSIKKDIYKKIKESFLGMKTQRLESLWLSNYTYISLLDTGYSSCFFLI